MFIKRLFTILISLIITSLMYPQINEQLLSITEDGLVYTSLLLNDENEDDNTKSPNTDKINIVFTMDDGWETQYTKAYQVLDKYGFKGSIGIIPSRIGQEKYMTYRQISDLYIKGWGIVNHSYNHLKSHKSTAEEVADIESSKKWMDSKLLKDGSNIYIAPYGSISEDCINELKNLGYKSVRTLKSLIIFNDNKNSREYEIINLTTDTSSEDVLIDIENCIAEGKDIIFVSHKFGDEDDGTGMYYKVSEFENIVKFIKSKEDCIQVKTYTEYINDI